MTASLDPSRRYVLQTPSLLLANLAALWAADPAFAAEVEAVLDVAPYPVEISKAGEPTLALESEGRRIYLHSRYRPLEEAQRLIDGADLDGKAIYCVHGFGLGYHVESLFERVSDEAVIVVMEPDLRLIRTALEHRDYSAMLRTGRIVFLNRSERGYVMFRLARHDALVGVGLGFVTHGPSMQAQAEFHRQMQGTIADFVSYARTSLASLVFNGRRTCENLARNLRWYVTRPGVGQLKERHRGQPAIIVSAGPSLRKNKHLLREAAGKAVIIAVQTTLLPLLEMGVEPTYVTSLDYHAISSRFFERVPRPLSTVLVAEPKVSPAVLDQYPGPICLVGSAFADKLLAELKLERPRVRAGGTVAHLAFYLAEFLGCDPIIFVGQDLGFSDGLAYVPGTSYDDVWRPELGRFCTMEMKQWEQIVRERPILKRIEDWQGRPMYTEERLFAYLQQFERDFTLSPARIINATEGGALRRGAEVMTLREALERFCQSGSGFRVPGSGISATEPGTRNPEPEALTACIHSVERRLAETRQIRQVAEETLPLLQEIRDNIEDDARVNRLIARLDLLRMKMMELDSSYELVAEFDNQVQIERFRSDRRLAASQVTGTERQKRQIERDIAHVVGLRRAAEEFEGLLNEVIGQLGGGRAAKENAA